MNKVFAVIRREFIERVRTRAFLIATLLGPLFFIGISVLPALLLRRESVGQWSAAHEVSGETIEIARVPSPSMPPSRRSPATTAPTPAGVPVKTRSPGKSS